MRMKPIIEMTAFCLFVITIFGWLIWAIYSAFYIPEKDNIVKFEVVGITNSENATTLVQLHYECMKYCMSHSSGDMEQEKCWEQCALLGKEGCQGVKDDV